MFEMSKEKRLRVGLTVWLYGMIRKNKRISRCHNITTRRMELSLHVTEMCHLDILWKGNETYSPRGGSQKSTFPLRVPSDLFHFEDTFRNHSSPRFIRDLFYENRYLLGGILLVGMKCNELRGNSMAKETENRTQRRSSVSVDRAFVRVANENWQRYVVLSRLCVSRDPPSNIKGPPWLR